MGTQLQADTPTDVGPAFMKARVLCHGDHDDNREWTQEEGYRGHKITSASLRASHAGGMWVYAVQGTEQSTGKQTSITSPWRQTPLRPEAWYQQRICPKASRLDQHQCTCMLHSDRIRIKDAA
eukprot:jgi/Ulvmu1/8196/UM041_0004.1